MPLNNDYTVIPIISLFLIISNLKQTKSYTKTKEVKHFNFPPNDDNFLTIFSKGIHILCILFLCKNCFSATKAHI